jgi:hypothetical protein
MEHLLGEHLQGIPSFFKVGTVQGGSGIHDQETGLVGLEDLLALRDHLPLVLEINRFKEEEAVCDCLGIGPGDLTEPLDREPFCIDIGNGLAGPEGSDRSDDAQGALPACRFTVDLGDGPDLKTTPEQGIKGSIPAGLLFCFREAPPVSSLIRIVGT